MRKTKVGSVLRFVFILALCVPFLLFFAVSLHADAGFDSCVSEETLNSQSEREPGRQFTLTEIKSLMGSQPTQTVRQYKEFGDVESAQVPLDNDEIQNIESFAAAESSTELPFPVTTIRNSGKPDSESIVVVFMGEGFTKSQLGTWPGPSAGTFLFQAAAATNSLINTHPFSLFADNFTVYALQVESAQSGITGAPDGTGPTRNTYFNVRFTAADYIVVPDTTYPRQLAASVSAHCVMAQIIANTDAHGGVAYRYGFDTEILKGESVNLSLVATQMTITSSGNPWIPPWHGTVIHEFGHSFGRLVDEHETGARSEYAANSTIVSDSSTIKWKHWLPENAGIETGIMINRFVSDGWAVPAFVYPNSSSPSGCIMRASWGRDKFCFVCAAELTRRMATVTGEVYLSKSPSTHDPMPTTENLVIPTASTRLLPYAFNGNERLRSVNLPVTVATVGDFAFIGATGLQAITNYRGTPQTVNETTFAGLVRSNIKLFIPLGTTAAYEAAGWTGFDIEETLDATVTVTGLAAVNRAYDGTTVVQLTGGQLHGINPLHDVRLPTTGNIATAGVGENKPVTITLEGVDAGLYALAPPSISVDISRRMINIESIIVSNKVYDGTDAAIITGVTFSNVDSLPLSNQPTFDDIIVSDVSFSQSNVGSVLPISYSAEMDVTEKTANFILGNSRPDAFASITRLTINLAAITAQDKDYDGTTTANIIDSVWDSDLANNLLPVLGRDFFIEAAFEEPNKGFRTVNIRTLVSGTTDLVRNFVVGNERPSTTAEIRQKEIIIESFTVANKTFDGTDDILAAGITGIFFADVDNMVASLPTLAEINLSAKFAQATVGTDIVVSIVSVNMKSGTSSNFLIGEAKPTAKADILRRTIQLQSVTAVGKEYDGTDTAMVTGVSFTNSTLPVSFPEAFRPTLADLNLEAKFVSSSVGTSQVSYEAQMGSTALARNFILGTNRPNVSGSNIRISPRLVSLQTVTVANKIYDGTNAATIAAVTFTNVDTLEQSVIPKLSDLNILSVAFSGSDAGANLTISYSISGLVSPISDNFILGLARPLATATISQREIVLTAVVVEDKEYDGNNLATITDVTFSGLQDLDVILWPTLSDLNVSALFSKANAGVNQAISYNISLGSSKLAQNFILGGAKPTAMASILKREIELSAIHVANKTYDGNKTASVSGIGFANVSDLPTSLQPGLAEITVNAEFSQANAGSDLAVLYDVILSETVHAENFKLGDVRPVATANILKREVNLASMSVADKTYDGSVEAFVVNMVLTGMADLPAEIQLSIYDINISAAFVQADAGSNIAVNISGMSLVKNNKTGNYVLGESRPVAQATIMRRPIELLTVSAKNKSYDGTKAAEIAAVTFSGVDGLISAARPTKDHLNIVATFSQAEVGAGLNVTISSASLKDGAANNFILSGTWPSTTASINKREISFLSIQASNKMVDGTDAAVITSVLFSNLEGLAPTCVPLLGVDFTITASFSQIAPGNGIPVTIVSVSWQNMNFILTEYRPTTVANIVSGVAMAATVTGLVALDRQYDGTTLVTLSGGVLNGVNPEHDVRLPAFAYVSSAGAGSNKKVFGIALIGEDAYLYDFTPPSITVNIAPRTINIASITVADKVFDGTDNAVVIAITLSNIDEMQANLCPRISDFIVVASFADSNAGADIVVSLVNVNLIGMNNFVLGESRPTTTANIARREVNVSFIKAANKVYDGTTEASITEAAFSGVSILPQSVRPSLSDLDIKGCFARADVGSGLEVYIISMTLSSNNFSLGAERPTTTANITRRILGIVSVSAEDKIYDGTNEVQISGVILTNVDGLAESIIPVQGKDFIVSAYLSFANVGVRTVFISKVVSLNTNFAFESGGAFPSTTISVLRAVRNGVNVPSVAPIVFDFGLTVGDVSLASPWIWETPNAELFPGVHSLPIIYPGEDNYLDLMKYTTVTVKHRAPDVAINGTVLTWQNMPNNYGFGIYVDGELVYKTEANATEFDLASLGISINAGTLIQVKTIGSDGLSSDFADVAGHNPPEANNDVVETVIICAGSVLAIFAVGLCINVLRKKRYSK